MMGYGAREEPAREQHDPLSVRALYLESGGSCLFVSLEVCLIAPQQAAEIADGIAAATGLEPGRIFVTCIHTHSGPDTGFGELLGGRPPPDFVAPILAVAVRAGVQAVRNATPARLGMGEGSVAIGRNRRREAGPVDRILRVVRVDREGGAPLAVLYIAGCHPTVLGHDNLAWSADWPWAANLAIEEALPGALPLFLLSAHGDVDPRTRGLQDLAIPGQSVGCGFDIVEQLGREVGDEVVRVARGIETGTDLSVESATTSVRLPTHRVGDGEREAAHAALGLAASARYRTRELYAMEAEKTRDLPAQERRERIATLRRYLRNRAARAFAFGEDPLVRVQLVRIGALRLLGLPLEATVDVGLAWAERTGHEADAVLSIAGGWMRYLPHPRNFEEPGAHLAYEILQSTFVPEAALRLLEAGARWVEETSR
ncbi:MAG: hypothetical protein CL910_01245 [Deltaproteobacteria bacterium]|jgi:hypothetical protein|nr:hypothetical protein [Deltaproteobacteria bacterium]